MGGTILTPAAVLVVWTLVLLGWMFSARARAIRDKGLAGLKFGARGRDFDGFLDDRAQWKAHSYNYQFEQPTVFYAVVFILVLGGYTVADTILAWLYVALRVVHSVWQAAVNRQPTRMYLFVAHSAVLAVLAVRALMATL